MKEELLNIVNEIREAKNLPPVTDLIETDKLREDLEFTSFDSSST